MVGRAGAVDEEEDARYGVDVRGDEMPEELKRREDRLEAIRQAKARLEARRGRWTMRGGASRDRIAIRRAGGRISAPMASRKPRRRATLRIRRVGS